jgi:LmbE family N-acetylglucosaminyl deacetylase
MFSFSKSDKVLIVAPHPDDESLGTGGLLQRIFTQKIPVRILFATNGENNPWAHRYWERRWRLGPEERARWGQRRRAEALDAIGTLGGKPDCARFLNLPDWGITDLLMRGDPELSLLIDEEIQDWEPTMALIPTMVDAHRDHSALSVAFSMALDSPSGSSIRVWEYLVHKSQVPLIQEPVRLHLSVEEVECKRKAILCHETQVALSRRRFTSFAKTEETYYPRNPFEAKTYDTSLTAPCLQEGILSLEFKVFRPERFHLEILFAFKSGFENKHRWKLPVPFQSGKAQMWDTIGHRRLPDAKVQWRGTTLSVDISARDTPEIDAIYAKLSGWPLFFDRSGWSQLTVLNRCAETLVGRQTNPGLLSPLSAKDLLD